tara:strand:- start:1429 stop:1719 length:291 start_codon:yes stop_codon:yes gene_type:complete
MGIFSFLKSTNDKFFSGLTDNLTKKALAKAKEEADKKPVPLVVKQMRKLEKEKYEIDDIIKKYSKSKTKVSAKDKKKLDALEKKYSKQIKASAKKK